MGVKEGMSVDGTVLALFAKLRVLLNGHKCINRQDRAVVPGSLKNLAGFVNSGKNLRRGSSTVVDKFVSDADGVNDVPVAIDGINDQLAFILHVVDIPNTEEKLHVVGLGARVDLRDLVTLGSVDADERVRARELSEILLDLIFFLALVVTTVWGVRNAGEFRTA
jgi:hypothetical protein